MFWFSRLRKALSEVEVGSTIKINAPEGYCVTYIPDGICHYGTPISAVVINNSPKDQKIYLSIRASSEAGIEASVPFLYDYSAKPLRNFIVLNKIDSGKKKRLKTREEIQIELKKSVKNGHFEMAAFLNEQLMQHT